MQFEWDEAKSERTFRERGFGFDYAAGIFDNLTLERRDDRRRERRLWHSFAEL